MLPNDKNPIVITRPLRTRQDFFDAVASAVTLCPERTPEGEPSDRDPAVEHFPVPQNLDALADLLRQFKVRRIVCSKWRMGVADTTILYRLLRDLNIDIQR